MIAIPQNTNHSEMKRIERLFQDPLVEALGDPGKTARIEFLTDPKGVEDDTLKLVSLDRVSRPTAVVLYSSDTSPHLVSRGMDIAQNAKLKLGDKLGSVILNPLSRGEIKGKSFTILPYRQPLSSRKIARYVQVRRIYPEVLRWLRGVVERTSEPVKRENLSGDFLKPLNHIIKMQDMDHEIRDQSVIAIHRLKSQTWKPKYVLMHGDLYKENLLFQGKRAEKNNKEGFGFILIDWPGCLLRGYAMYDLVRLGRSIGLKKSRFMREVYGHCRLLECESQDAAGYLLAALGHIGLNLEHFPFNQYIRLIRQCFYYLKRYLDSEK